MHCGLAATKPKARSPTKELFAFVPPTRQGALAYAAEISGTQ
jgi:hypothetical protein